MPKTLIKLGPQDHGRRMRLKEFDHAEGVPGYIYELSRGVITVMQVPKLRHFLQVDSTRRQFERFRVTQPESIFAIANGSECKILLDLWESERHPDLAIYLKPPVEEEDLWATWIPEIVIEFVSRGSKRRDYLEKREEYLDFGVLEYWIIDADKEEMLVLRRSRGRWVSKVIRPPEVYRTPLLPKFDFHCKQVFQAAKTAKR